MFKEIIGRLLKSLENNPRQTSVPIGGRFVLHCNFQTSELKISLPAYYKECFDAWSEVTGKTSSCYEEIINEIIWNHKFLCYDKKNRCTEEV